MGITYLAQLPILHLVLQSFIIIRPCLLLLPILHLVHQTLIIIRPCLLLLTCETRSQCLPYNAELLSKATTDTILNVFDSTQPRIKLMTSHHSRNGRSNHYTIGIGSGELKKKTSSPGTTIAHLRANK